MAAKALSRRNSSGQRKVVGKTTFARLHDPHASKRNEQKLAAELKNPARLKTNSSFA
jgi:hypothetical protein